MTAMTETMQTSETHTRAWSMVRVLLHIEGLAVLLAVLFVYGRASGDWGAFVLLLLTPDLSAVGFLVNTRVGSMTYNSVHTYTLPIALGVLALAMDNITLLQLALIWTAHIGMDRTIGYGLKYPTAFKDTHLSRV